MSAGMKITGIYAVPEGCKKWTFDGDRTVSCGICTCGQCRHNAVTFTAVLLKAEVKPIPFWQQINRTPNAPRRPA